VGTNVDELVDELLADLPPAITPANEFLGAQFDRGLAWLHYPLGYGGLGLTPNDQQRAQSRLEDGVIHVESPSASLSFNLGQFFKEWGIPLSSTQVGSAQSKLTVFFTAPGKKVGIDKGNPADLPLGSHYQIQIDVGTPIVKPVDVTNVGSL
jgi:hypothetical protein